MKEINEEILLTLNLMQTDIDEGAHSELQGHLYSLLEMKRNEIQRRLTDRSQTVAKPLTTEELMLGNWWCTDVSEECANAFKSKGLSVYNSHGWGCEGTWAGCTMDVVGDITRVFSGLKSKKQIHRIGNEFYWGEK